MFNLLDVFIPFIFSLGFIFVVWLLIREIVCWYYKINEQIENQKKTNELLNNILTTLNQKNSSINHFDSSYDGKTTLEVSSHDFDNCDFDFSIQNANECREGNYTDWRVPTKEELVHIFKNKHNFRIFKNDKYWSSSKTKSGAYVIDFSDGVDDIYRLSNVFNVFFVRGRL